MHKMTAIAKSEDLFQPWDVPISELQINVNNLKVHRAYAEECVDFEVEHSRTDQINPASSGWVDGERDTYQANAGEMTIPRQTELLIDKCGHEGLLVSSPCLLPQIASGNFTK